MGTHLLGGEDVAIAKEFEGVFVVLHLEVADVAQVGAFGEGLEESGFVDNVLTGGIDYDTIFRHGHEQVVADAAARFGR